jgi:hypothetical protein
MKNEELVEMQHTLNQELVFIGIEKAPDKSGAFFVLAQ